MSLKRELTEKILRNQERIREWYQGHARVAPPPFYCSVDLRDSGFKIAPVDSNLYPAGFNNICPIDQRNAAKIAAKQVKEIFEGLGKSPPKRILILPENHTQNTYYIENLYYLREIFAEAGFEVAIGWYTTDPGLSAPVALKSASGKELQAFPLTVADGIARAGDFEPDLIVLNNDFSSGYPKLLDTVVQPILPSHTLGWHSRKKSEHFLHYNRLAEEFADLVGIDPWLIQADTQAVDGVNFNEGIGVAQVADAVERMLARTREAYAKHGVKKEPFVFVKNNRGTYGIGIMVVHKLEELAAMNRRTKNKMSVGKNRQPIESVIVQEGLPTAATIGKVAAEPVIYLMRCELIGGFLRTNTQRGVEDNLNSEGMVFRKLCVSDLKKLSELELMLEDTKPEDLISEVPILELLYGTVARISALAAGREIQEHTLNPSPSKETP